MNKKLLAMLLCLCMILSLLAACGGGNAPAASSAEPAASESSVSAQEPEDEAEPPEEAREPEGSEAEPVSDLEEASEEPAYEDTFSEDAGVWPICDPGEETLTIWDGWFPFFSAFFESYDDTLFFQEMERRTGVKTEFTLVNAEQALEQFNLMVATGDFRDLMHDVGQNYTGGLDAAWEDEVIIPIDPLIDEWMPNYKSVLWSDPKFIDDLTSDEGNIYEFSIVRVDPGFPDYGLVIRKDWLEDLNL